MHKHIVRVTIFRLLKHMLVPSNYLLHACLTMQRGLSWLGLKWKTFIRIKRPFLQQLHLYQSASHQVMYFLSRDAFTLHVFSRLENTI